jgi:DNA-binding transcriptional MerR regulator
VPSLAIGDFARASHLSVRTLRHYHRIGLLEPAEIDPHSGYRRYTIEQIPTAQVIRRFRDLDMPLEEIGAVVSEPNLQTRNLLIATHLSRLEASLARTQRAVASLRDLLEHPGTTARIDHRRVPATRTAAISETIDLQDALPWFRGALGELQATLAAQRVVSTTHPGGIFQTDLFANERGEATVFVPCEGAIRPLGRVKPFLAPAAELAVTLHVGAYVDLDRAYGALATYVAQHALGVDGPVREYYVVSPLDSPDESAWRTEVGWPIFATAASA